MSVRAGLACGFGLLALCGGLAAQPPRATGDPAAFTLQEVTTAWNQLREHGCLMAAYMTEVDEVALPVAPLARGKPLPPAGKRPDLPARTLMKPSVRAYAISLPPRTTDADLARLTHALAHLPNLRTLDIGGSKVGDAGVKNLKKIPELQALFLDRTQVGDEGLKAIAEFPHLTWLDVSGAKVSDVGAAELATSKSGLRVLRLADNAGVTDVGLRALAGLGELKTLDLAGTGITLAGRVELSSLKSLRRLNLARTGVGDDQLRQLATISGLEELDLSGTAVSGAGLGILARLRDLRTLRLNGAALTDDGSLGLAALPHLRELDIGNPRPTATKLPGPERSVRLTDVGLGAVGCCKSLRKLAAARTAVTGLGLKTLGVLPELSELDLEEAQLSDDNLGALEGLKSLRVLNLARTAIQGNRLDAVAALPRLQALNLEGTTVTDVNLSQLAKARELQELNLRGTGVTAAGIEPLWSLPLVSIDLYRTKVTAPAVKTLAQMKSLRMVVIEEGKLEPELFRLRKALPQCTICSPDKAVPLTIPATQSMNMPRFPLE
jgi:Leucine-rich repeat (LRR) protein